MSAEDSQPENHELLPGALLRAAREKARLSEEDVASELHITVKKVHALEGDDYQQLHSDIFIRGYLRGYAKLVDLEPEALLENYAQARRQAGLDSDEEQNPLQINIPEPRRPLWHFGLGIGLLLLMLWAGSVWFLDNRPPADPANPEGEISFNSPEFQPGSKEAEATGNSSDNDAVPDDSQQAESGQEKLEESQTPSVSSNAMLEAPSQDTLAIDAAQSPEPREELDLLRLVFSGECWVEVVDARGDVLETDLLLAGQSLELRGEAPFEVKLGNAQAVEMELNGEPFAFEPPEAGRTLTLEVIDSQS